MLLSSYKINDYGRNSQIFSYILEEDWGVGDLDDGVETPSHEDGSVWR